MSDHLSKWLSEQLNGRGWSIRELSRRAGLGHSYVSRVVSGKQEPGAKFFLGMAQAFGVTVGTIERIAQGELPQPDDDLTFKEIFQIVKRLSPAERQEVLDYALFRLRKSAASDNPDTDKSAKAET